MLHIWTQERLATATSTADSLDAPGTLGMDAPSMLGMDAPSIEDMRRNHVDGAEDYEIVLGRRQVASLAFVVLVFVAVFAGMAYLAGRAGVTRAASGQKTAGLISAQASAQAQAPGAVQGSPLLLAAAGQPAPTEPTSAGVPSVTAQSNLADAPLFADPIAGAIYIQTAATDKGVGVIMAEGLRTHGLNSFVAPGPNDKVFRVLVGPFPNVTTYQQTKIALDQIGVSAFARFQK